MAEVLWLASSGGFGGIGLGRETRLDMDALPEELRAQARARLDPEALEALAGGGGADRMTYRLHWEGPEGAGPTVEFSEAAAPAELLDLIDALLEAGR